MRLWTLHPQYLDSKGLVAAWREALLAQKVLAGCKETLRHTLAVFIETENFELAAELRDRLRVLE